MPSPFTDIRDRVLENDVMMEVDKLEEDLQGKGISRRSGAKENEHPSSLTFSDLKMEYVQYLVAACVSSTSSKKSGRTHISPPSYVLDLWHLHLLETESYEALCTLIIGEVKKVCPHLKLTKIHSSRLGNEMRNEVEKERKWKAAASLYEKLGFEFKAVYEDEDKDNNGNSRKSKRSKRGIADQEHKGDSRRSKRRKLATARSEGRNIQNDSITFNVRMGDGEIMLFKKVSRHWKIDEVNDVLCERMGCAKSNIRLYMDRKLLCPSTTITDNRIENGDILRALKTCTLVTFKVRMENGETSAFRMECGTKVDEVKEAVGRKFGIESSDLDLFKVGGALLNPATTIGGNGIEEGDILRVRKRIKINVRMEDGETLHYKVRGWTKINDLKHAVGVKIGYSSSEFDFFESGMFMLNPSTTFADNDIKEGDTLQVIIPNARITLNVRIGDGQTTIFKVRESTKIDKVKQALCQRFGIQSSDLDLFKVGGLWLNPLTSIADNYVKDEDTLYAKKSNIAVNDRNYGHPITLNVMIFPGGDTMTPYEVFQSMTIGSLVEVISEDIGCDPREVTIWRKPIWEMLDPSTTIAENEIEDEDILYAVKLIQFDPFITVHASSVLHGETFTLKVRRSGKIDSLIEELADIIGWCDKRQIALFKEEDFINQRMLNPSTTIIRNKIENGETLLFEIQPSSRRLFKRSRR